MQVTSVHSNPFIKELCPDGYTLKLLNSVESKRPAIVEAHNQLMWKLKEAGFRYGVCTCQTAIYRVKCGYFHLCRSVGSSVGQTELNALAHGI